MQNIMEKGRSMVEMLGVLAIIGVLSIGGLSVYNRMQYEQRANQIVNDLTETITKLQKIGRQYDDGYNNVGLFAYKNKAYSGNWEFNSSSGSKTIFTSKTGAVYTFDGTAIDLFVLSVSNIDDNICIKLATTKVNHLQNLLVNGGRIGSYNEEVTLTKAADACNKGLNNKVNFSIKGF